MQSNSTRIRLALKRSHPVDARLIEHLEENRTDQQDLLRTYARAGYALMQGGMSASVAALLAADEEEICRALALVLAHPSMRTKALSREIRRAFFEDEHGLIRPIRKSVNPISDDRDFEGASAFEARGNRELRAPLPPREIIQREPAMSSRDTQRAPIASLPSTDVKELAAEGAGEFVDPMEALSSILDSED